MQFESPSPAGFFGVFLLLWLGIGLVFGLITQSIWKQKGGSPGAGFALGFFLGVIGLIIAFVATPSAVGLAQTGPPSSSGSSAIPTRECPFCKTAIRADASVCPHCQRESEPWRLVRSMWVARNDAGEHWYLDQRTRNWFRVRSKSMCPNCGSAMSDDQDTCPSCHTRSSPRVDPTELGGLPGPPR